MKKQIAGQVVQSSSKKSYQTPKLHTHGGVEKLTLGASIQCFSDIHYQPKPSPWSW